VKSIHLIVHGLVQGVYFRKHTQEKALALGIKGFVRNLPDSGVEIEAEGEEDAMQDFISWCRRGPERAKVTRIDMHEQGLKNFSSFEVKR